MGHRQFAIGSAFERANDKKDGDMVVAMAFASQEPYERWWGIEILDVNADSVRLGRLNDGAPLLYNHDWRDLRGTHVPGSVKADSDGVLRPNAINLDPEGEGGASTAQPAVSGNALSVRIVVARQEVENFEGGEGSKFSSGQRHGRFLGSIGLGRKVNIGIGRIGVNL